MYRVEQVVIPVDLSAASRVAVEFARRLGDARPRLHLAHAMGTWSPYVRRVFFPYAALGEDDVAFEYELREEARKHLLDHLEVDPQAEDLAGLTVEPGPIGEVLAGRIRRVGPDLVVMGAAGDGGAHPHLLGSTAEKLLRTVSQPVVLVQDYATTPTIDHVVVAVDLTSHSPDLVAQALGVALQVDATVELVFVLPDPLAQDTNNLLARSLDFQAASIVENSRAQIEALFERMVNHIEVNYPNQDAARALLDERTVIVGDPAAAVVDHADAVDADLVVVGNHSGQSASPRPLGRVAWTIARTAPMHVMVGPPRQNVSLLDAVDE